MTPQIQEVKAHLGLAPRTAQDLAESTGFTIEDTYHCLAWLNDRDQARMAKEPRPSKNTGSVVIGWVEGAKA